jgi:ABC-type branched-subunit amino acid transport system substrate-binding protein
MVGDQCTKIDLIMKDVRSDAATTVAATRSLLKDDGVHFLIGPTIGLDLAKAGQISQAGPDNGAKPMHLALSTVWELSGVLGNPDSPGAFRMAISVPLTVTAQSAAMKEKIPDAKTIYFLWQDDDSAKSVVDGHMIADAKANGLKVVGNDRFPPATTDFSSFMLRVKAKNPDILEIGYTTPSMIAMVKAAEQLKMTNTTIVAYTAFASMALKDAIGKPVSMPFLAVSLPPDFTSPDISQTLKDWLDSFGKVLGHPVPASDYSALWYYNGVYMMAKAMQDAGEVTQPAPVIAAMKKVRWNEELGPLCFDDKNTYIHGMNFAYVKAGQVSWYSFQQPGDLCAAQ